MTTETEGLDVADRAKAMIAAASKMPSKSSGQGRRGSLKEAVALALPALTDLKSKGYSDAELTEFMKTHGFVINPGTLRNYMAWAARNQASAQGETPAPKAHRPARTPTPPSAGKKPDVPLSALAGRAAPKAGEGATGGKKSLGHRLNDDDL